MSRKQNKPPLKTMSETLRQAITESGLSFAELERRTGVTRQSLMKFARREQTIRLDHGDKLAGFFGMHLIQTIRRRKGEA